MAMQEVIRLQQLVAQLDEQTAKDAATMIHSETNVQATLQPC